MDWNDSWAWLAFGFLGNTAFFSRFLVQWIASEKAGESIVPRCFWHLSLAGTFVLLIYAIHKRDPVFTLAYLPNAFVYVRNLMLIKKSEKNETASGRIGSFRAESSPDVAEARG